MMPRYAVCRNPPWRGAQVAGGARRLVDAFPYKILARAAARVMEQHSEKSWGSCVLENITNEHKNGLNRAMSGGTST